MTAAAAFLPHLPLVLGLLAGVLSVFAYAPYIRDTLTGRTRPERASWLIWAVLGSIGLASQIHEGAGASVWLSVVQVSGTVLVAALAIRRGVGGWTTPSGQQTLALAALGVALWIVTDSAVYALGIAITVNLLGGWATVAKAYGAPDSETLSTWALSVAAALCAIAAIGSWDPILLAYPVYLLIINGAIVAAVLLGRARQARQVAQPGPVAPWPPTDVLARKAARLVTRPATRPPAPRAPFAAE